MREENQRLKERLGLNSNNSSKLPSSDAPGTPRQLKKPTGRRPGGQPGHKKHERKLLPPEQVQHFVELVPKQCKGCGRRLMGKDGKPHLHQVVVVPPLSAIVTEYRSHALECSGGGTVTREEVPAHASSAFGDRLGALASLLVGKYRLSKRLVKDALSDMLGVQLSVGSVVNLEGDTAEALAQVDRGGKGGQLGEELLCQRNLFFTWYHRVRDGTMSREDFEKRMPEVEREVGRLLHRAAVCAENKTAGMAREILRWEKCLWTFVDVPGLEPTNNFGEWCLRHAVMYRKTSFGTQGPEGSRFVERILTVVTTLKLQRRGVLEFLTDTLKAHRRGHSTPALLPTPQALQLVNAA